MEFDDYQRQAQQTNLLAHQPQEIRLLAAMLGLATEVGSLLDIHKKVLTEAIDPQRGSELFQQELGDLLWYVAAVAKANDFSLEQLATDNLARTRRLWEEIAADRDLKTLPVFDSGCPEKERFPRYLEVEFTEGRHSSGKTAAQMRLLAAEPNVFPDGPTERSPGPDGKPRFAGFKVGQLLGDPLTDNNRRTDGYRFHDAIHLGFLATLNWSATFRSLLRVKRSSDVEADESEDGARAIFAEEGLAAVLSRLAPRRMGYRDRFNVDGETLEIVAACVEGLEVAEIPGWAWRRAIITGFEAMNSLFEHRGGVLTADLDERKLDFRPL